MYSKVIKVVISVIVSIIGVVVIIFGAGRAYDNAVTKIDTNAANIDTLESHDKITSRILNNQQELMKLLNLKIDQTDEEVEENEEDIEKLEKQRSDDIQELIKAIKEGGS